VFYEPSPGKRQQVANARYDDVTHRGLAQHLLDRLREVFQHDDGLCAGVCELIGKLVGCIEGIDVDDDQPGSQRAEYGDGILQHVGQHDRDTRATCERQALLQKRSELSRETFHVDIGERAAKARERGMS
jgi:hypothetical protein